ncbi:variable surface protein [Plasmodium gonderi]|uniref:Variable surface protein n=1 Tax=Plasmodium gonderi TaxID=77519 RepID=A0A1Y1JPE2_PLAGO|nr:variable surface protein [Plasmodium gonderi]GAW84309.1 variable surface protein [Plasmodium gonderi]
MEETINSPHLKLLPSYIFYQKLINQNNKNNISHLCKDVLNTYNGEQGWAYNLCGKLIKNIEMLRDDNDDFFGKKHCFDINYWFYSEVYKNIDDIKKKNDLNKTFNMFIRIWEIFLANSYGVGEKTDKELCHPYKYLFKENLLEYLIQVKNFFDYMENYKFIKNEINENTYYACQKYSNYLKDRIPLFFSFEPLCKKQESNICTDHFYSYYHLFDPRNIFTWYELFKIYIQSFWNGCYKNILYVYCESQRSTSEFMTKYNEYVQSFIKKIRKTPNSVLQKTHGSEQGTQINVSMTNTTVPTSEFPKEMNKNNGNLSDFVNEQGFSISKIAIYSFFSVLGAIIAYEIFNRVKIKNIFVDLTPFGHSFTSRRRKKRNIMYAYYSEGNDSIFDNNDSMDFSSCSEVDESSTILSFV